MIEFFLAAMRPEQTPPTFTPPTRVEARRGVEEGAAGGTQRQYPYGVYGTYNPYGPYLEHAPYVPGSEVVAPAQVPPARPRTRAEMRAYQPQQRRDFADIKIASGFQQQPNLFDVRSYTSHYWNAYDIVFADQEIRVNLPRPLNFNGTTFDLRSTEADTPGSKNYPFVAKALIGKYAVGTGDKIISFGMGTIKDPALTNPYTKYWLVWEGGTMWRKEPTSDAIKIDPSLQAELDSPVSIDFSDPMVQAQYPYYYETRDGGASFDLILRRPGALTKHAMRTS